MKQDKKDVEIQILKKEFEKLNSIEEKLDFWEQKLDCMYILKEILPDHDFRFKDFDIVPKNGEEIKTLNLKCLDLTIKSRKKSKDRPIDSDVLIKNYQRDIIEVKNKEAFKESTLEWINSIITEKKNPQLTIEEERNEHFLKAYEDYLYYNIEPNYAEEIIDFDEAYEINNGFELAKYHEYVVKGKLHKSLKISQDFQILLLDYLGIGKDIDDSNRRAKLYAQITNRSEETTKRLLTNLNEAKSLENLTSLRKLFTEIELPEQLQIVEKDLENMLK